MGLVLNDVADVCMCMCVCVYDGIRYWGVSTMSTGLSQIAELTERLSSALMVWFLFIHTYIDTYIHIYIYS